MRTWKDQFVKNALEMLLRQVGQVDVQHQIAAPDPQWADVWFQPHTQYQQPKHWLGWLGKMSDEPCLIEVFSEMPSDSEILACARKRLTKQHLRESDAAAKKEPQPAALTLWILAPAWRPALRNTFGMQEMDIWPKGFWISPPGLGLGWVSFRDLTPTRDTLLLRFMATEGPVFQTAVRELLALPEDAPEKLAVKQILIARRLEVTNNQARNTDEQEEVWTMSYLELYEQWRRDTLNEGLREGKLEGLREGLREGKLEGMREGLREGIREGKLEGLREGMHEGIREGKLEGIQETILTIYRTRFASVPDELERRVRKETNGATLMSWCNLFTLSPADEIARKLAI